MNNIENNTLHVGPPVLDRPRPMLEEMPTTDVDPILGLDNKFPEDLILLKTESGQYGCWCHEGTYGVACFEFAVNAKNFATMIYEKCPDVKMMSEVMKTFDEARDIAKDRPMPITCLFLLDNLAHPETHWVK